MVEQNNYLKLEEYAHEYENDPEYIAEGLSIKIVEEMLACLKNKGVKPSWLAQRMGVSRAHVSKILNAPSNMTLLTIAKIAVALGVGVDVCLNAETKESGFGLVFEPDMVFDWHDQQVLVEVKGERGYVLAGASSGMSRDIACLDASNTEFITLAKGQSEMQKPSEKSELVRAA